MTVHWSWLVAQAVWTMFIVLLTVLLIISWMDHRPEHRIHAAEPSYAPSAMTKETNCSLTISHQQSVTSTTTSRRKPSGTMYRFALGAQTVLCLIRWPLLADAFLALGVFESLLGLRLKVLLSADIWLADICTVALIGVVSMWTLQTLKSTLIMTRGSAPRHFSSYAYRIIIAVSILFCATSTVSIAMDHSRLRGVFMTFIALVFGSQSFASFLMSRQLSKALHRLDAGDNVLLKQFRFRVRVVCLMCGVGVVIIAVKASALILAGSDPFIPDLDFQAPYAIFNFSLYWLQIASMCAIWLILLGGDVAMVRRVLQRRRRQRRRRRGHSASSPQPKLSVPTRTPPTHTVAVTVPNPSWA